MSLLPCYGRLKSVSILKHTPSTGVVPLPSRFVIGRNKLLVFGQFPCPSPLTIQQHRCYNPYNTIDRQTFRIPWMYTEHAHKGHGWPIMWVVTATKPSWQPHLEEEHEVIARDEFGVPMQVPPEISTAIKHVYYVPPQYYPLLKKLGDDTPQLKPYMEKLINGNFTREDYEELFYSFAKPLKVYRQQIPMPYRSVAEMLKSPEVHWEGAWLSYKQRVAGGMLSSAKNSH